MIPVRDRTTIRVRVYAPVKSEEKEKPLVVMFHEGGWCMGDLTDEDMDCRLFVRDLGVVAVNVEYRYRKTLSFYFLIILLLIPSSSHRSVNCWKIRIEALTNSPGNIGCYLGF